MTQALTTARQIKAIFTRLLERNGDLVLIDRVLVLKPVRHFARAVFIDRTSSADLFQPQTALLALFVDYEYRPLIVGEWLYRKETSGSKLWLWSDPSMPEDLFRIVEQDALSRLRSVRTPEDYLRYAEEVYEHHFPFYWGLRLSLCVALGRFDEARAIMNDRRWSSISPSFFNNDVEGLGDRLKEQGSAISHEDRKALVSILHEREARSVENLKLSGVWERTPFPIELEK